MFQFPFLNIRTTDLDNLTFHTDDDAARNDFCQQWLDARDAVA